MMACTWYEGDAIEDVPDDYEGPCIHCDRPRHAHGTLVYLGGRRPVILAERDEYAEVLHDKTNPAGGALPANVTGLRIVKKKA